MARPETAILGTGWSFPPTFSRAARSVDLASGVGDVEQSLRVLFATAQGERLMLPEYGTPLSRLVFRTLTAALKTELAERLRVAILFWEPRIDVASIEVRLADPARGLAVVDVAYTLRTTNARNNFVYPFYLEEGTLADTASRGV